MYSACASLQVLLVSGDWFVWLSIATAPSTLLVKHFIISYRDEEKGQVLDPSVRASGDPDLPTGGPA